MSGIKKGWCPTLERPMESGDGLLVRLHIESEKITVQEARAIAAYSAQYGNSQIDLTSRGNLQIRGVSKENYAALYHALSELGFTETPRTPRKEATQQLPELGLITSDALALGLLFGRMTATSLAWLADVANEVIMLSSVRIVYLHGITANADALLREAEKNGFIIHTHDARRKIEACSGAPACSSANGDTRNLAIAIAQNFPNLSQTIHVSGCAKGCACAKKMDVVITATNGTYNMAFDAIAADPPVHIALMQEDIMAMFTRTEAS